MKTLDLAYSLFAFTLGNVAIGQEIISEKEEIKNSTLLVSGSVDAYYGYYTHELEANVFQPYTTVSPRSERFGLNIAQIGVHYNSEKVRSNFTLHYGDIPQATWSSEFRNIQEANVGFQLVKDWWLDLGLFTTHIGTESFIPKNNFLSSNAVVTYNEPFYQAGAKLTYEGFEKLSLQLWVVNGYNFFLDKNDAKSFGTLLSYQFNETTSLTYTNLLGRESLDSISQNQFRTYHNLYLNTRFNEQLFVTLGGDFGTQSNSGLNEPNESAIMFGALVTVRYQFNSKWSVTTRGEFFKDKNGFISGVFPTNNGNKAGLQLWGITLGGEFKPAKNSYIRIEARYLDAENNLSIFDNGFNKNNRYEAMLTLGYSFNTLFDL